MASYYNEIDPFAAQWLRELIKQGHIADGIVDERSIEDVIPADLMGFTQCHFFAGIGVWSYALRQAGWPDDRPVWTGSCPCQPFSTAGKGGGVADERQLWPAFFWLIKQCRPERILGEQVANKAGESWFDLVRTSLEAENYAAGVSVFPACGVGAPHLRKRLYWVANNIDEGSQGRLPGGQDQEREDQHGYSGCNGTARNVADAQRDQEQQEQQKPDEDERERGADEFGRCGMADARPCPTNGFWRDADWLVCRDEKWRPVEPSTSPLANESPARVGRLRGYGNALVAEQAKAFIEAVTRRMAGKRETT